MKRRHRFEDEQPADPIAVPDEHFDAVLMLTFDGVQVSWAELADRRGIREGASPAAVEMCFRRPRNSDSDPRAHRVVETSDGPKGPICSGGNGVGCYL